MGVASVVVGKVARSCVRRIIVRCLVAGNVRSVGWTKNGGSRVNALWPNPRANFDRANNGAVFPEVDGPFSRRTTAQLACPLGEGAPGEGFDSRVG